jgi:predicted nucleotidyltransferase
MDMRWRATADLDLVLAVDEDVFPAGLEAQPGWTRDPRNEHEWHGPNGVRVDAIPAGPRLLSSGMITWEGGNRMSLTGMRHVFSTSAATNVGDGVVVRVPPLHVLALLKMISYLDRPAQRERDLADLGYIFEEYEGVESERRYAEYVPPQLGFEARPAFLLGRDLAPLLDDRERAAIDKFIALASRQGGDATNARLLRRGPPRWRASDDGDVLEAIIRAFDAGVH